MRGTKTSTFHDFWMFEPWGTLTYGFKYTKNLKYKNNMETSLKYIVLAINMKCLKIEKSTFWNRFETDGHRQMMKTR